MRTIDDTINNLLVVIGGGLISGDIVAFLLGLAQKSLVPIEWYVGIGLVGFILVLAGESRIYKEILLSPRKKTVDAEQPKRET